MGDLTLFEALTGGDRLNWQQSGEFDQNFSNVQSQMTGVYPVGGGGGEGGIGGFGIDRYIRVGFQKILILSPISGRVG